MSEPADVTAATAERVQTDTRRLHGQRWYDHMITRRTLVLLFAVALLLYLPGIWWGVPHATGPERVRPWGSDELAPLGPVAELYSVFISGSRFNPQYPLFHYFVQALLVGPYVIWLAIIGQLRHPSPVFPFGFKDPVRALATMTILARTASALLAGGVVVMTARTAATLWDRRTGLIAALLTLLLYPMFFYARTSNVDMAALFWTAAGFSVAASALRDGLSTRRALVLGVIAALAAATKDAAAFAFIAVALVLVPQHLLSMRRAARIDLKPLLIGLLSAAAVYAVAGGAVFSLARFRAHVQWMRGTSASMIYPGTFSGTVGLLRETAGHTIASLGIPTALLAAAGLVLAFLRARYTLWLVLVAVITVVATILPIRFVNFRYVLIVAYSLSFFAAFALGTLFKSRLESRRRLGSVLFAIACGWSAVRAVDLTYQMIGDGRYSLSAWLRSAARPGDRIAFFGASQKLPALDAAWRTIPEPKLCSRVDWARQSPDFVLIIPQQHFEIVHEASLHEEIYRGLNDGSLGYAKLGRIQRRGLTSRLSIPFVNPPMEVYARQDRAAVLPKLPTRLQQPALLAGLEKRLGLEPRIPAGLTNNPKGRSVEPCHGVQW